MGDVSGAVSQTTIDMDDFPKGCGCAYCQNDRDHSELSNNDGVLLKDLAVLSGGGGTVTPASIGVNNAAELIHGNEWGAGGGTAVNLTYSFVTSVPSYYASDAQEQTNFSEFTSEMKDAVRTVLGDISTFANVTFTEVSGVGDLTYGQAYLTTTTSDPLAWGYYPDQAGFSGDVWFNNKYDFSPAMDQGEVGYFIALHETGHAMGLIHSFDAGLSGNENTEQFTVMAYDIDPWGDVGAQSYMLYDMSALQAIYGANTSFNSGNTTYVLDPNAAYTIWDGGGNDTLDGSAVSSDVIIHLEEGGFSSVGLSENIAIAYGAVIENAETGSGDDTIYGNAVNNILRGGSGDDTLEGGAGNDSYVYTSGIDNITETTGIDTLIFDSLWNPLSVSITDNTITLALSINEIIFNDISLVEFFSFDGFADMSLSELIDFVAPNNAPIAQDDVFVGDEDTDITGNLLVDNGHGVDSDPEGDTLSVVAGTYVTTNGSVVISANGDFTYTPNAGYTGLDNFDYTLEDGNGGSNTGSVSLTLNAVGSSAATEVIVDNGDATQASTTGSWGTSGVSGFYGSNSLWSGSTGSSHSWDPILTENGEYEISAWWPSHSNRDASAVYEVHHANGVTNVTVDQTDGSLGGQWNALGSFILDQSSFVRVVVDGSGVISADAMRFTPTGGVVEPPPVVEDSVPQVKSLAFDLSDLVSFSNQDTNPVSVSVSGAQVEVSGNTWKRAAHEYEVTSNTVLEFDFQSNVQGEIHGIGLDTDNSIDTDRSMQIYGSQNWGANGPDYTGAGAVQSFDIDLSSFYTVGTTYSHITFVNDDDANSLADSVFDNIRIYERGTQNADTLIGTDQSQSLVGLAGADVIYGGAGDDVLYGGSGVDELYGQGGADTFMFEAVTAFTHSDNIQDFDLVGGDKIDIADLLVGYDVLTDAITDFVQITDNGTDSYLAVDVDGGADNFIQVATLLNVIGLTDEDALEASGNLLF